MTRLRYRLARWLLGYPPIRIPNDQPTIVTRSGNAFVLVTPLTLTMTSTMSTPDDTGDLNPYAQFIVRRTGRIEGTF